MRTGAGNRWSRWIVIMLVWLGLTASPCGLAQSPVGGGGGGGGGMGGGGAGGSVSGGGSSSGPGIPVVNTSFRQSKGWGGRSSLINLLANESVRRELGLSETQRAKAIEWADRVKSTTHRPIGKDTVGNHPILERARRRTERLAAMNRDVGGLETRIREALKAGQRKALDEACAKDKALAARTSPGGTATSGAGANVQRRGTAGFSGTPQQGAFLQTNVTTGSGSYVGGGAPGSPLRVIGYPAVRRSLWLTAEQDETLDQILSEFGSLEAALLRDLDRMRPTPTSRAEIPPEAQRAAQLAAQATDELSAMLTPEQNQRLRQISIQADGATALLRPEVVDALKLNATQQARLASLAQQTQKKAESYILPPTPSFDPAAGPVPPAPSRPMRPPNFDAADRVRQQGAVGMMAVLTSAQRQAFEKMQGRPFAGLGQLEGFGGSASAEGGEFRAVVPSGTGQ